MKEIGFSTGFSYKTIAPLSLEAIDICRQISTDAIEINCIGAINDDIFHHLNEIPETVLTDFKHVSLHAPCKNIVYRDDETTRRVLDQIQIFSDRVGIECVVIHPDLVENWKVFRRYNFPLAIENMEQRKNVGKTKEDLERFFAITNALFVLDMTHCFSIDPSLSLAIVFLKNFKDRLCEIHLSGFIGYHEPLHETHQLEMLEILSEIDVPIIIESTCKDKASAKREYDYIRRNLQLIEQKEVKS